MPSQDITQASESVPTQMKLRHRKKEIDDIFAKYMVMFSNLKKKRDKIIVDFIEVLKHKRLEELRNLLEKL